MQTIIALALLGLLAILVGLQSLRGWTFEGFTKAVVLNLYVGFFLPIFCLCVGTNGLGGDWEERSLVWLLIRPLPRPLIYAGKFLAAVPWTFGLTLGGLWLLGAAAGRDGLDGALRYTPAVALGTLAYLSLFFLMGAWFRRSTVVAVAYAFVLETMVGSLPGLVKRGSVSFYTKCLVYDAALPELTPDKRDMFMPIAPDLAIKALVIASVALFCLGLIIFSRKEYHDLT